MVGLIIWLGLGWVVGVLINHAATILPTRQTLWQPSSYLETSTRFAWSFLSLVLLNPRSLRQVDWRAARLRRAIIIEVATPLLFGWLFQRYGVSTQLGLISFYTAILLLITVTDLEHKLILNVVMLPAIVSAIALAWVTPMTGFWTIVGECRSIIPLFFRIYVFIPTEFWSIALFGGAIGFLTSYAAWLIGVSVYGPGALGTGDVTLSTFLGLILGVPYIFMALFMGVILGALIPLLLMIMRRIGRNSYIPYGPFLTVSGWLMLVWGNEIWLYFYC